MPGVDTHTCRYGTYRLLDSHLSVCQQLSYCGTFDVESDVLLIFVKLIYFLEKLLFYVLVFLKKLVFNPKYKSNRKRKP